MAAMQPDLNGGIRREGSGPLLCTLGLGWLLVCFGAGGSLFKQVIWHGRSRFLRYFCEVRVFLPHLRVTPSQAADKRNVALGDSIIFGWLVNEESGYIAIFRGLSDQESGPILIMVTPGLGIPNSTMDAWPQAAGPRRSGSAGWRNREGTRAACGPYNDTASHMLRADSEEGTKSPSRD